MDVELGHDVPRAPTLTFSGRKSRVSASLAPGDLLDELGPVGLRQLVDFPHPLPLGDQDQPGEAAVLHQQHAAERQAGDEKGCRGRAWGGG